MIDLTALLRNMPDDAGEDASASIPQRIEELDAEIDQHDAMLQALMSHFGLVWCSECGDVHQPDSHTINPNGGSKMGFPSDTGLGPLQPVVGP